MLNVKPFDQSRALCGPAVLKIVLAYFGINKSETEILKRTGSTRREAISAGIEAEKLVKVAKHFKLAAKIKDNSRLSDINVLVNQKKIPVIVEWFSTFGGSDAHFSVVVGIDKENIYLQDPQIGHIRAMRLKDFRRVWFTFEGDYMREKSELILRRLLIVTKPHQRTKPKTIRVPKQKLMLMSLM